jgi:putative transposase
MKLIKTYRFKLKLTKNQEQLVDEYINTSRCLYNLALETRLYAYKSHKVYWNYYDLSSQLTDLRKEFDWIRKLPSNTCQDVLERQEKAFKSFFKRGGFPKFAKKDKYNSITFKNVKQHTHNRFKIEKVGSVKYFKSREIEGKIQRATIIRKNNNYYISVTTKQETTPIKINKNSVIGIDLGITKLATLSDGSFYDNIKTLKKYQSKLRIEQRSLSRKKRGSNLRDKQKNKINKLHDKVSNIRKDYLHKITTEITNQYDNVIIEDLNISKMLSNKTLSKNISDASWGTFKEMLEYKSKNLVKINPAYTSQTCNACGVIDKKSRISQAEFVCTSCGNIDNADINASKNILREGISQISQRKSIG